MERSREEGKDEEGCDCLREGANLDRMIDVFDNFLDVALKLDGSGGRRVEQGTWRIRHDPLKSVLLQAMPILNVRTNTSIMTQRHSWKHSRS